MDKIQDVQIKLGRIRELMDRRHLDSILLATTANFAWITSGGDDHVELTNKNGVATVVVKRDKVYVVTNNIEAPRLLAEELTDLGFEIVTTQWFDPISESIALENLIGKSHCASDIQRTDMPCLGNEIATLRYELTPLEIERYKWLGPHSTMAVEKAARSIEPGMSEIQIAGEMARNLMADGMIPVVLLVANDDRNFNFRHPVPTEKRLDKYSMLVCCARRWGLITSRTRSVYFGKAPQVIEDRQRAVCYVDAVFMTATQTGAAISTIFRQAQAAYSKVGFAEEWRHHHQGGSIGYESRDYIGMDSSQEHVASNQAFTWNPTIQGTKSEDTIIATSGNPEIITLTGQWPTITVDVDGLKLERPDILTR